MSAFFSLYLYSSKVKLYQILNFEFIISKLLLRTRLDTSKYIKSIIKINITTTLQLWQWTPPSSLDRKMLPQFKWKINIRYLKKETFVELQVDMLRLIKYMGFSGFNSKIPDPKVKFSTTFMITYFYLTLKISLKWRKL